VVDEKKLSPDQLLTHTTQLTQLGILGQLARPRLVEKAVGNAMPTIDPKALVERLVRPRGTEKR
jgi:hypothetical protein